MQLPLVEAGAAFTLALLGGVHCVAMCGGFVSAIQFNRAPQVSAARLAAGYHLGRITSYTVAGALIGVIGGRLYASEVRPVQVLLLALGSLALVAVGLSMFGRSTLLKRLEPLGVALWRRIAPLARHVVPPRRALHAWLAGLAWGWIPCGMVYAALPLALTAGGVGQGAFVMLAFGLGTLPAMLAVDVGVTLSGSRSRWPQWRQRLRPLAGALIVLFGVSGLAHAAAVAGLRHPAVAMLASLCGR